MLFALIIVNIGYIGFKNAYIQQCSAGAFHIADATALDIDVDMLDSFYETGGDSEAYRDTWKRMDELCNVSEATFIYVIRPDLEDFGHITFLFSTVHRDSGYTPYEVGYVRETTNDASST